METVCKDILLTGGARGIGKALTRCLLETGYNVCAVSSNQNDLKTVGEEFADLPGEYTYRCLDLSQKEAIAHFCTQWNKPLYALINNAATNIAEWLADETVNLEQAVQHWEYVLQVNTTAPLMLGKALLPKLTRPGRIVNIASQLGHEGRAAYGSYCASKWGLIGLTKSWAKELGPEGITVNAVSPGWVRTELHETKLEYYAERLGGVSLEEAERDITRPLELKRFNTTDEVAGVVKFLLSHDARGVTGQSWLMSTVYSHE